jgi:hypothetical protein
LTGGQQSPKERKAIMGLDMYLTGRKYFWQTWDNSAADRCEDGKRIRSLDVDLGYWRKHPNLHGYIVQAFAKGKDDCEEIELSADDIRNIIGAVKAKRLPKTEGFFFGASDGSEHDEDLKVLNEALTWLEATDPDPFEKDEKVEGPGFTALVIKPKPQAKAKDKRQNVTRSVHYRASW